MAQFTDVADVRPCARAHVDTVADLDDAEFAHTRWKKIHVGAVGWHDRIDFISSHDGISYGEVFIYSCIRGFNKVGKHLLVKGNRVEINTRAVGMNLISNRSYAVEHLVGQTAHQMLSSVHAHVSVACGPIDGSADFITNLELVPVFHRVVDVATTTNFGNKYGPVWTK